VLPILGGLLVQPDPLEPHSQTVHTPANNNVIK